MYVPRKKNHNHKVASNVMRLDPKNPIPYEPTGESEAFLLSSNSRKYIPFLAPKDNFFQLLLEAKLLSPTNNSCVNSKIHFCVGDGLFFKDETQEDPSLTEWMKRVNKKGQHFNKVIKTVFNNYLTVGNAFVEVIRGKIGTTKFIKVVNRPFLDCRLSLPNSDDISESVFISKKFRQRNAWTLKEDEVLELPIYYGDTKMPWYKSAQGTEHCILHIKNEVPGYEYYGMPDNVSSLPWQIMEYKGARYNIDNFENNMVIGGTFIINGNLTDKERIEIAKDVLYTHTGDGNNGRIIVLSGQNMDASKSGFQPFDVHKDGSFLELDENTEKKIINSNNWDSSLYGQHKTTGMGNGGNSYLTTIYNIKKKTVIEPLQRMMKEEFLSPLFEICDKWMNTEWSNIDLGFKSVSPTSFISDIDVNKILTKDEGREILGYPNMTSKEKGESIIDENKQNKNIHV
ncbi:phage portal protein [Apibacter muscae]|uniref:Phage portal protein n=1 Tax=Apibacter muscae TaxID=2509004 RepID=A0A563DER6_9FLAO|nr:phage portal protein [Apibacter muscae]TWP28423.1 phage portal protein [Apibacter muscae]